MHCIVTAGPTYESLDAVRRLTNFSTGSLGAGLANYLTAQGHHVTLLKGYYSTYVGPVNARTVATFTTTADLAARLHALADAPFDAVFHAAAVSDFTFGRVYSRSAQGDLAELKSGKFSTRAGTLLAELTPTPKIISFLRSWFPSAHLAGWKYEVEGGRTEALAAGFEQLQRCRTDACVVNGPAYGDGFGLLSENRECLEIKDAAALYEALARGASAHLPG